MVKVAFVGALSSSFADRVRAHLTVPCDIALTDENKVVSLLPEVDVLVTLVFTEAMGEAGDAAPIDPGAGRRARTGSGDPRYGRALHSRTRTGMRRGSPSTSWAPCSP